MLNEKVGLGDEEGEVLIDGGIIVKVILNYTLYVIRLNSIVRFYEYIWIYVYVNVPKEWAVSFFFFFFLMLQAQLYSNVKIITGVILNVCKLNIY